MSQSDTFLEFVLRRYIGSPQGRYWQCPWCNHPTPSLQINPGGGRGADKLKCHRCFGHRECRDEDDIVKFIEGDTSTYPQRLAILSQLRNEWSAGTDRSGVGSNPTPVTLPAPGIDWGVIAASYGPALSEKRAGHLTDRLGLPWSALGVIPLTGFDAGFRPGLCQYTFPEVDASGTVIGIFWRRLDGEKGVRKDGHRGLTLATGWRERPGPTYVVEGASDTLAMTAAGLSCVGRFSAAGGVKLLGELFRDDPEREVVIVGDSDEAGQKGAASVSSGVSGLLGREIRSVLPPVGFKDVRAYLTSPVHGTTSWADRGQVLARHFEAVLDRDRCPF